MKLSARLRGDALQLGLGIPDNWPTWAIVFLPLKWLFTLPVTIPMLLASFALGALGL